ncbi:MAG: hypothetical protein U0L10_14520, partial [Lachnospiraceae bacterium]|nr:hypothetical protein [Lachnospiraceae bacterium]
PLFYVHHRTGNTPLSEDAVEAFIKKYAKKACTEDPTFPNHCYPHMWRNPNFNKIQTFCWSSA